MKHKQQILYIFQQIFYWLSYCTLVGFASVYLIGKGFADSQIGLLLASTNLISVLVQFIISRFFISKLHLKTLLQAFVVSMIVLSTVLIVVKPPVMITVLIFALIQTLHMSLLPYVNSLGLAYEKEYASVDFSIARGFGSMGFAFASFGIGKVLNVKSVDILPLFVAVFLILLYITLLFSPKESQGDKEQNHKANDDFFKRYPKFLILIIALILVFTFHNFINAYLPQIVTSVGGNSADLGLALMIGGLSELPAMFMYTKLSTYKKHSFWVIVSFITYLIRSVILISLMSVVQIQFAQVLQALSFALLLPSVSYLLQDILLVKDQVFGQTLFTISMTLGGVFGTLFGGFSIDFFGVKGMLVLGSLLCLCALILMVSYLKAKEKVMIHS